jgi:hypothetical protein
VREEDGRELSNEVVLELELELDSDGTVSSFGGLIGSLLHAIVFFIPVVSTTIVDEG